MESECIIIALIYLERLIKYTRGSLSIQKDNWHSILFACLILASKVWDDLSMWNIDFSHVLPTFTLKRINELELAILDALNYVVKVTAGEYAKYYFLLRSMMARLGICANEATRVQPLDMAGARKLEISTEVYQEHQMVEKPKRRRGVTVHEGASSETIQRIHSEGTGFLTEHHTFVGLEQVVHQDHVAADGMRPLSSRMKNHAEEGRGGSDAVGKSPSHKFSFFSELESSGGEGAALTSSYLSQVVDSEQIPG